MSTIIDYASPASRSSLRLPARSEIRWDRDAGDRLRITQVLAGAKARSPRSRSRGSPSC